MGNGLEEKICYHCGPVLIGIKSAGLISIHREELPDLPTHLGNLNHELNNRQLYFQSICSCGKRCMLLVYHRQALKRRLAEDEIRAFLESLGYPVSGDLSEMILFLEGRIRESRKFPHEVGLFLGYPLEDVLGFCKHRGRNYKLSGYWKVYGDAEAARRLFRTYTVCRNHFCKRISEGLTLAQLLKAA